MNAGITLVCSGSNFTAADVGTRIVLHWDANGDGNPDSQTFGSNQQVKIHLDAGQTQKVGVEVMNAFGLRGMKVIPVTRPAGQQVLEIGQR